MAKPVKAVRAIDIDEATLYRQSPARVISDGESSGLQIWPEGRVEKYSSHANDSSAEVAYGRNWPGADTQRQCVNLSYTSTGRQSAHWHRVRLGPLSALSDA
ncbi:TPA: hypothetical protein JTP06_004318 [Escherichia coli]|nr:hypothetical protein [Escherichia coli]